MRYYFYGAERLQFLGLNPNETACVIIYLICVLWIVEKNINRIQWQMPLYAIEIVALICLAQTFSRGGVVALLIVAIVVGILRRGLLGRVRLMSASRMPGDTRGGLGETALPRTSHCVLTLNWRGVLKGFATYPIWRVSLITLYPGIWSRMSPTYLANDASVGNRLTLWTGGLKLHSGGFMEGWGWEKTGLSYMNWVQPLHDRLEYNGMVNSFLLIGVGFGGLVLTLVLFYLILGLVNSCALVRKSHTGQAMCGGFGEAALPDDSAKYSRIIGSVCLLWTITWIVCSLFSTMMRSSLLVVPVVMAILLTFILSRPKLKHILMSLGIAVTLSMGLYVSGALLSMASSFSVTKKGGVVHVINKNGLPGKICVFYADECALGNNYGKAVRRYMEAKGIRTCVVITNGNKQGFAKQPADENTVFVLSGDAVSAISLEKLQGKIILLYPHCNVNELGKFEYVKQVLFPEIDPLRYRYSWQRHPSWGSRVELIPYDSTFKTKWPDYIIDI